MMYDMRKDSTRKKVYHGALTKEAMKRTLWVFLKMPKNGQDA